MQFLHAKFLRKDGWRYLEIIMEQTYQTEGCAQLTYTHIEASPCGNATLLTFARFYSLNISPRFNKQNSFQLGGFGRFPMDQRPGHCAANLKNKQQKVKSPTDCRAVLRLLISSSSFGHVTCELAIPKQTCVKNTSDVHICSYGFILFHMFHDSGQIGTCTCWIVQSHCYMFNLIAISAYICYISFIAAWEEWKTSTTTVDNLNLKKAIQSQSFSAKIPRARSRSTTVFVGVESETGVKPESHRVVMILVTLTWEKPWKIPALHPCYGSSSCFLRFHPGHHWWKHFATCGACAKATPRKTGGIRKPQMIRAGIKMGLPKMGCLNIFKSNSSKRWSP